MRKRKLEQIDYAQADKFEQKRVDKGKVDKILRRTNSTVTDYIFTTTKWKKRQMEPGQSEQPDDNATNLIH